MKKCKESTFLHTYETQPKKLLQWCAIEMLQQVFRKMFQLFWPPSHMNLETNDTSFESPYIGRLESAKNWGCNHPEGGHAPLAEKALLL